MKILFAGSTKEAAYILEQLNQDSINKKNFQVTAVLTTPDSLKGRKLTLTPTPVKLKAKELNLPVFDSLEEAVEFAKTEGIDLAVVVAYGKLLKTEHLQALKFGWINLHFSLLPNFRGAAPVQRAIESGTKITGVTVFQITEGLDEGPIFSQFETEIKPKETSGELLERLGKIGVNEIVESIEKIDSNQPPFLQPELENIKYASKLLKTESRIDWQKSPKEIVNKINAFSPNPGAYFLLKVSDKEPIRVVVTKAGFSNSKILQNDLLKTPVGIELLKVKPAGKTEMDMNSWLNGLKNLSEFEIL